MFWKKHKWKIIVAALILAVLAGTFYYGGGAPGTRGWSLKGNDPAKPTEQEEATPSVSSERPGGNKDKLSVEEKLEAASQIAGETEHEQGDSEYSAQKGMQLDPETGLDRYGTSAVPEGKPVPVEPQDVEISDVEHKCTISISCATILDNMEWLDKSKVMLVPEDGWILKPIEVTFYEGESVFNVLMRTCKQQKIHMEFENTPMYNSAYIEGINNLYEFDVGELSGWIYKVNGWSPNYGCSRYALKDGDVIEWQYTCNLGIDIDAYYAVGG